MCVCVCIRATDDKKSVETNSKFFPSLRYETSPGDSSQTTGRDDDRRFAETERGFVSGEVRGEKKSVVLIILVVVVARSLARSLARALFFQLTNSLSLSLSLSGIVLPGLRGGWNVHVVGVRVFFFL